MAMTTGARYTLVPDCVDALLAMFTAAALTAAAGLPAKPNGDLPVVEVLDGEPITDLPDNYVAVGYSAAFAATAFAGTTGVSVEGARTLTELGNRQFGEQFTVDCEASTFTGDSDPGALSRQRRYTGGVLAAMWRTVEDDPTLGGIVTAPAFAAVTTFRWLTDRSDAGVSATVSFGVAVIGELMVPR